MILVDALKNFAGKISITEAQLKDAESSDSFSLTSRLAAGKCAPLVREDINSLVDGFGDALSLKLGPSALPTLEIAGGRLPDDVDDRIESLKALTPETEIEIHLTLDKNIIAKKLAAVDDGSSIFFYFFKENCAKLLKGSLIKLDETLFTAKSGHCVIVISDSETKFVGRLLGIYGESHVRSGQSPSIQVGPDLRNQLDRFYADEVGKPSWIGFGFKHLTPLHFVGTWDGKGKEADELLTAVHLLNLSIIFTANRTSYKESEDSFQSTYASPERTARLDVGPSTPPEIPVSHLSKLVEWLSTGKDDDRLTIFQNIAARRLSSDVPSENYRLLASILPSVFGEAQWHYQVFVDGKIGKHFEEVQKLNTYVADAAKKIAESLDSVTKGLADALLATIGVLVVTVLAALVKNDASSSIFTISMSVYALYLLFYAVYRMGSVGHSYRLLVTDADEQITAYKTTLLEAKVNDLKKPLDRRRSQFNRWFWGTVLLYLAIGLLIWQAGNRVPAILVERGLVKPTPTPTPTPPPSPANTPAGTTAAEPSEGLKKS